VADDYDRVRPAYPEALFDDVLGYTRTGGRRALEAGAGTGRATAPFAARGLPIVAVEPDDAMADRLVRRVAPFPHVEVVRATFEEFRPAPSEQFGLLFSAEAWHWTAPETRWSSAAGLLAEGAALALFFNNERIDDPALRAEALRVLTSDPTVVVRDEPPRAGSIWSRWPGGELAARPELTDLTSRAYSVSRPMPKADFLALARTRSQFRMLPPPARQKMLADLTGLFDDEVPLTIDTTLILARRR
jgi:SAM-dependent methyltransferase